MKSKALVLMVWIAGPNTRAAADAVIDFESFALGGQVFLDIPETAQFINAGESGVDLTIQAGADNRIYDLYRFSGDPNQTGQALIDWYWGAGANPAGTTLQFSPAIERFSLQAGDFGGDSDAPLTITAYDAGGNIVASDAAQWPDGRYPPFATLSVQAAGIVRIVYRSGGPYPNSTFIDNFTFSATAEPDCNTNGVPDALDLSVGTSADCNATASPDECDIAVGRSEDVNADGIPDECGPVCVPSTIVTQPVSKTVCAGDALTLNVAAEGMPPPAYLWRKDGVGIAGATAGVYVVESTTPADSGAYDVEVSNACGSIISDAAVVVAWPLGTGDVNGDGTVNGMDIATFVETLLVPEETAGLASCAADMDLNGVIDNGDLEEFMSQLLDRPE